MRLFNYSLHVSGIPISEVRKQYSTPIAGGVDEINYRKLTEKGLTPHWRAAQGCWQQVHPVAEVLGSRQ